MKLEHYLTEVTKREEMLLKKLHSIMKDGSFKTATKWASLLHWDEEEIRPIMLSMKGLHVKTLKGKFSDIKIYGLK